MEINHEKSSFYITLYKSIDVQLLGMLLYSQLGFSRIYLYSHLYNKSVFTKS